MPRLTLLPGRERSLRRKHPWLFSGAVAAVDGSPGSGDTVDIHAHSGEWLARGAYSPTSQIRARVWTFDESEDVDSPFFERRVQAALAGRDATTLDTASSRGSPGEAARLLYSESDGLPGVVVDRYGDYLVCQFLSAGAERWRVQVVSALEAAVRPMGIYERSDADARRLEGLGPREGVLAGGQPPDLITIAEGDCRFFVDVRQGHKTGFYLDQRENRSKVRARSRGAEVLNCFSYTGGFGIAAAVGGASRVTNIETSGSANALAMKNVELNGLDVNRFEFLEADVFGALRGLRDGGRKFDLVVLDPPKFAESEGQVEKAARAYKDVNLHALKLLAPGGLLFTFSCSGHVKPDLFQKIVADAALDARRDGVVLERLGQPADHPTALGFPEASYLKGLMVRVH
jgi:23S rRNA (cytosine1962-C5)-methyltransferase